MPIRSGFVFVCFFSLEPDVNVTGSQSTFKDVTRVFWQVSKFLICADKSVQIFGIYIYKDCKAQLSLPLSQNGLWPLFIKPLNKIIKISKACTITTPEFQKSVILWSYFLARICFLPLFPHSERWKERGQRERGKGTGRRGEGEENGSRVKEREREREGGGGGGKKTH